MVAGDRSVHTQRGRGVGEAVECGCQARKLQLRSAAPITFGDTRTSTWHARPCHRPQFGCVMPARCCCSAATLCVRPLLGRSCVLPPRVGRRARLLLPAVRCASAVASPPACVACPAMDSGTGVATAAGSSPAGPPGATQAVATTYMAHAAAGAGSGAGAGGASAGASAAGGGTDAQPSPADKVWAASSEAPC